MAHAMLLFTFLITATDGRQLTIPINDVVHPKYEYRVPNEGMPSSADPSVFGDMVVDFVFSTACILCEHRCF